MNVPFLKKGENLNCQPIEIFMTEVGLNLSAERNTAGIYQLTPSIHFTPKDISLNKFLA